MKRKFGIADKLGYMFGDFGNDSAFILSSMFLLKFYTDVMVLSASRWYDDGAPAARCVHGCDDGGLRIEAAEIRKFTVAIKNVRTGWQYLHF